jgi:hypothetical protein
MDINGFREAQSPWFFNQPPSYLVEVKNTALVTHNQPKTLPTHDSRYPGWAAPMSDGRISTDYRTHCEVNIPTGMQYASRRFMQRNAESLIEQARKRQASSTGAGLSYDASTVMPANAYVGCDTGKCTTLLVNEHGVGVQRREHVPELFGTFAESQPSIGKPAKPSLTQREEGGRNTRR